MACGVSNDRLYLYLISLLSATFGNPVTKTVEDANYWRNQAQDDLNQRLSYLRNTNAAKNVIMFLGDGMGISTVTAARIHKGQLNGQTGEETEMTFEKFPYTGFIKTYNTDQQVPDSAGTATAFLCGVKSKAGTVGVDDKVQYSNCSTVQGAEVTSILDWSLAEGKSVGLVTTTRVTHATPAAAYAHAPRRSWEGDTSLDSTQKGCTDIAYQLIKDNPDIQVILGGGRRFFLSINETDPELGGASSYQRRDTSLVQEWIQDKQNRNKTHAYAWRKEEFDAINPDNTEFVLGLFQSSHMQYEHERDKTSNGEPSLQEMTIKALEILRKNANGYFLLVEGGRIDHGHHGTRGRVALEETVMFDKAVSSAIDMTSERDTLIVVTADHSHVFAMGGYPTRGNNILGLVENDIADDGMPYTSLVYGNGPVQRENLTGVDTTHKDYRQTSAVYMTSETHAGEDIPVYARGPMAHLLTGTHEQSYIPHVMAYASCVGHNKDHCKRTLTSDSHNLRHSITLLFTLSIFIISIV
ncbi:alkaline phosphatase-like isoform X1 [Mytilus galloprovincialis]|uniref:alkaline phosphatase-like isoform X1 n=1 Tax=Mytilus galloprovincialis TaxID=29158 RepID=UPI003F7C925C